MCQSSKVNIGNACQKKWDRMQDVGNQERYCASCELNVQDFTNENEMKVTGGCGRFRLDQVSEVRNIFNFSSLGLYATGLLTALGLQAVPSAIYAQGGPTKSIQLEKKKSDYTWIKILGKIQNQKTGEIIPGASIDVLHKGKSIAHAKSNDQGKFYVAVDTSQSPLREIQISFRAPEFVEDIMNGEELLPFKVKQLYTIELTSSFDSFESEPEFEIMGEVDVVIMGAIAPPPLPDEGEKKVCTPKEGEEAPLNQDSPKPIKRTSAQGGN